MRAKAPPGAGCADGAGAVGPACDVSDACAAPACVAGDGGFSPGARPSKCSLASGAVAGRVVACDVVDVVEVFVFADAPQAAPGQPAAAAATSAHPNAVTTAV